MISETEDQDRTDLNAIVNIHAQHKLIEIFNVSPQACIKS
jgi:hypothetical protein